MKTKNLIKKRNTRKIRKRIWANGKMTFSLLKIFSQKTLKKSRVTENFFYAKTNKNENRKQKNEVHENKI